MSGRLTLRPSWEPIRLVLVPQLDLLLEVKVLCEAAIDRLLLLLERLGTNRRLPLLLGGASDGFAILRLGLLLLGGSAFAGLVVTAQHRGVGFVTFGLLVGDVLRRRVDFGRTGCRLTVFVFPYFFIYVGAAFGRSLLLLLFL